jgi:murein DD-endopeptidase MepM/ murein hydrolase activator NlpD
VTALRWAGHAAFLGAAAMVVAGGSAHAEAADSAPAVISAAPVTPAMTRTNDFRLSGQPTQGGWLRGLAPAGTRSVQFNGNPVQVAPDGQFLIAFDRDSGPVATLTATLGSGRTLTRALSVSPRAWKIEHIPIGPRPGATPSEAFRRIREGELAQINAARAMNTFSDGWRQAFVWPAQGRISGRFGSQRIYNGTPGSYHSGLDIATGTSGTPFVAPADGVVILAAGKPFTLEGNLLMIDHGMGLNSAFLHCSQLLVKVGDRVRQGQVIGRIGATGRATGPHLHWSIKWRDARLDPLLFTGPMR